MRVYGIEGKKKKGNPLLVGNGLKVAKGKGKKSRTHTFWQFGAYASYNIHNEQGVFSPRNFNDSIIPYYAYMGSSFAYINATEQQGRS